jgi:hypothetical protein
MKDAAEEVKWLGSFWHWKVKASQVVFLSDFFSGGRDYESTSSSVDHSHGIGRPVGKCADSRVVNVAPIRFSIERPFGMSIYCARVARALSPRGGTVLEYRRVLRCGLR